MIDRQSIQLNVPCITGVGVFCLLLIVRSRSGPSLKGASTILVVERPRSTDTSVLLVPHKYSLLVQCDPNHTVDRRVTVTY